MLAMPPSMQNWGGGVVWCGVSNDAVLVCNMTVEIC